MSRFGKSQHGHLLALAVLLYLFNTKVRSSECPHAVGQANYAVAALRCVVAGNLVAGGSTASGVSGSHAHRGRPALLGNLRFCADVFGELRSTSWLLVVISYPSLTLCL